MNRNPYGAWSCSGEKMVPCHRVVNSDGRIGGFARGKDAKIRLLRDEGIEIKEGKIDLGRYCLRL